MTDRWMWAALLAVGWPLAAAAQNNGIQIRPDGTPSEPPVAESPDSRSYVIPALEIVGFDFLLNRFNHQFSGVTDYDVSSQSIRNNLHGPWITDDDPFKVNQFAHPYQGSIYHTAARSAGLGYWTSAAYTFAGSVFWEIAGEQTPPSKNDQIASGIAGSFFGEPLFRMANLVLTSPNGMSPFWREVSAAAISPSVGFNRLAFGDRFRNNFESHDPVYYSSLRIGASSAVRDDPGTSTGVKRKAGEIEFRMDYGLPGKDGYTYDRPFDYFSFQALASTPNGVELLSSRGLLFGTDYAAGKSARGLWGLYGNYDYMAPQIFNMSTTGLSLGTTAQAWLSDSIALQGTGLVGAGYSAASTARGTANDRDYHYGVAPNLAIALRLIAGTRAAFDVSAHKYFLGTIANRNAGRDDVTRIDSAATWRLAGRQSIGVKYSWSGRNATYPTIGDRSQALGTVGIYYTLLGVDGFGVVDWREQP